MANIFAILTAIVLAAAAFLAYQNMGKSEVPGRGYKGWISKTDDEKKSLARKSEELKTTNNTLADTKGELDDYNGQNKVLDEEVTTQKEKNEQLSREVDQKKAEAESKAAEVRKKEDDLKAIGDVDEVLAKLSQTQRELAQIELDIAQKEAQRATLEAQRVGTEKTIAGVKAEITQRVSGKSNPNLNARVRSVYGNLGFVTLSGGDNIGIVKDSTLEVVRDGDVIAKLQVSTVESGTSAADIIPDSVAEGLSVRAGDQVRTPKEVLPDPKAGPGAGTGAPPAAAPAPAPSPEPMEEALPDPF